MRAIHTSCPVGGGVCKPYVPVCTCGRDNYGFGACMRWVAKNAVAAGLADKLEIQVAYAIGAAAPVGLYVESFGTAHVPEERIIEAIREVFDLRPAAIVRDLQLMRPIYAKTASYGHFGRELPDFTWERTDRVDDLRAAAGL